MKKHKFTDSEKRIFMDSMSKLQGTVCRGSAIERKIRRIIDSCGGEALSWNLTDHIEDCSYTDDAENPINEFYVHVGLDDSIYTDILCIINNHEDMYEDWIVLVKEIIKK